MNFSAVILAGGRSSRMGRDKAFLEIEGQTLLARQIKLAREIGAKEILISGHAEVDYSEFDCRVMHDRFIDTGPLAGIERALAKASESLVLALAVDMPNMSADFLRNLIGYCNAETGAIPRIDRQIEPLAAFYPKAAWLHVDTLLKNNCNAVNFFAEVCVQNKLAGFVNLPPSDKFFFTNWNSPADMSPKSFRQNSELPA